MSTNAPLPPDLRLLITRGLRRERHTELLRAGKASVLMSMDAASGETKELDRVPEFVEFQALAWTAGSRRVLYCKKQAGGSELWWVRADGGTPERLAPLGQSIWTLAMDPAGKRIAWTAKSTTSEIWALENLLAR